MDEKILMHKNIPVAKIQFICGYPVRFLDIYCHNELPMGVFSDNEQTTQLLLKHWYQARSIPKERVRFFGLANGLENSIDLFHFAKGIRLTDTYWLTDNPKELSWEEVNFHDNSFVPVFGLLLEGKGTSIHTSPDFTTDGIMEKFWYSIEKTPYLAKMDSLQENALLANEIVYYKIASALGIKTTPYFQGKMGKSYICSCPCFVKNAKDDFITAMQIKHDDFSRTGENLIHYFTDTLGFDKEMREMITLDCLFHNSDRHEKNFGVIKHPDGTYDFVPPFDNGYCLGANRTPENPIIKYDMKLFSSSREEILEQYGIPINLNSSFFLKELENAYSFYQVPETYYEKAKEELLDGIEILQQINSKTHMFTSEYER